MQGLAEDVGGEGLELGADAQPAESPSLLLIRLTHRALSASSDQQDHPKFR